MLGAQKLRVPELALVPTSLLAFTGACFTWGAVKAAAVGAHRTHDITGSLLIAPVVEELQYRGVIERLGVKGVTKRPELARLATSALFGLGHPGLEVDAAVGSYVYSKAWDAHGLTGALLSHFSHNLGCLFGGT